MSKITDSEIAVSALLIEGTNPQIDAINRHRKNWEAEFKLNSQVIPLHKWKVKKIDSIHSALTFPLDGIDTTIGKDFSATSKDLTFFTNSFRADEVLSPLINNGMKVRLVFSDNEFTLKKNSITFINKNKTVKVTEESLS